MVALILDFHRRILCHFGAERLLGSPLSPSDYFYKLRLWIRPRLN